MKKYIIIISLILSATCRAQTVNERNFQKEDFLSQFGIYFENAEMTENGVIRLEAKDAYSSLPAEKKNTVMEIVLSKWDQTLVSVSYGYKRELWQKKSVFDTAVLLDSWDLNTLYTPKTTLKTLQKTDMHPWFFYFGLNSSFNSDILNLNVASRIGFFLLKNRWDLALSYTAGVSGGISENDDTSNVMSDLGLMSKVYFPVKQYNISPYIGSGISYVWNYIDNNDGDGITSTSWNIPLYLGVSWYVGPGSLDFGFQISDNNSIFMVGYTFSLNKLIK